MVYSPTTWNTNDVITKDKLNKIEQGVKTGTLLSGTDIDADKDWNGKSITNLNALQAGTVNGIVPVPPPSSHLITVEPVTIDPVTIASYPGPYTHHGGHRFEETRLSFVIPSNLSDHGIPASHKLVRISVSYRMVTGTTNSYSRVIINGVDCSPLRQELTWYGSYDKTITQSIYVGAGSTLSFTTCNTSNDLSEPTISNIVVKLEGGYPFGSFTPAGYSTIAGVPNLPIAPYNFNNHSDIECTCDFGGISATMGDKKARPYFPQQPNAITLAWKPDKTWTSTQPVLQFYRGRT